MRIMALDYGRVHTGVALSDPSGTIVRPLEAVNGASSSDGLTKLKNLVESERADEVIVGLPVSLSGELGAQAQETEAFIEALKQALSVPVRSWDERYTSRIAAEKGRGSGSDPHSLAACCLLEDYLGSAAFLEHSGGE